MAYHPLCWPTTAYLTPGLIVPILALLTPGPERTFSVVHVSRTWPVGDDGAGAAPAEAALLPAFHAAMSERRISSDCVP